MPSLARTRNLVLLPLLVLVVLVGMTVASPQADAAGKNRRIQKATSVALKQVGDPYRYGSAGPRAFDCSGLLQYSFRQAGLRLPRTSRAQARFAHRIPKRKLKRGDLMFFHNGGRVYHTGIFLRWSRGRAVMVHAPSTGKRVQRSAAWTNRWFAATLRR